MAESMAGLKRSCRCAEVTEANVGQEMTLMGWVQKSRNKGGIIFTDLRDRSGIIQIIFEESDCGAESFAKAEKYSSGCRNHRKAFRRGKPEFKDRYHRDESEILKNPLRVRGTAVPDRGEQQDERRPSIKIPLS